MADRTPLKVLPDGGGDSTGLGEFVAADTVGVVDGGTGLATVGSNQLLTGNGTSALTSESNLTFDGTTLNVVGNAGVGLARTDGTLHVTTSAVSGASANSGADDLVVEVDGNGGMSILTPNDGVPTIAFGDPEDSDIGRIYYRHSSDSMEFYTNAAERMRIDSSGHVGIGTASYNYPLDVRDAAVTESGFTGTIKSLDSTALAANVGAGILLGGVYQSGGGQTSFAGIKAYKVNGTNNDYGGGIKLYTRPNGSDQTERLRIDSSGNLQMRGGGAQMFEIDATSTFGNANMSQGITINQGASDNEIMAFKSSDVSHDMTSLAEANTYGVIQKQSGTAGGASLRGFADTADNPGVTVISYMTGINSTKSTSGNGAIGLQASLTNGGGGASTCASDDNIVCIHNHGTTRFIFDAEGSAHADVEWTTFDTHDDIAMLHDIEATMVPDAFGKAMKYDQEYLMKIGILGKNSLHEEMPGRTRGMINTTKLQMLHHGAIRQVHQQLQDVKEFYEDKIAALEQRLLRLEA